MHSSVEAARGPTPRRLIKTLFGVTLVALTSASMVTSLTACGQKGPLYLPTQTAATPGQANPSGSASSSPTRATPAAPSPTASAPTR